MKLWKKGDIDIYPEFTGMVTESLLQPSPKVSHEPEQVYDVARDGIAKQDHLAYLKPMSYQIPMLWLFRRKLLKNMAWRPFRTWKKWKGSWRPVLHSNLMTVKMGNKGLQSMYGLNLNVATMEPALRYQAIQSGDIQITGRLFNRCRVGALWFVRSWRWQQLFPPTKGLHWWKKLSQETSRVGNSSQ